MANMPASVHTLRISAPASKHIKVSFSIERCVDIHGANKVLWFTGAIRTQASQQLKANIPLHTHGASMDLKDVCATL